MMSTKAFLVLSAIGLVINLILLGVTIWFVHVHTASSDAWSVAVVVSTVGLLIQTGLSFHFFHGRPSRTTRDNFYSTHSNSTSGSELSLETILRSTSPTLAGPAAMPMEGLTRPIPAHIR